METGRARRLAQRLSLFDLDNTLIAGDSDHGWAQFLIEAGVLDAAVYERRNAGFFADYKAGSLDIRAFLDFQLRPLAEHEPAQLLAWRERFMAEKIEPMFLPAAKALVDARLARGDLVAVVTATNSFITRPITQRYGISHLIATEPEMVDGRFTGRTVGEPCFREGKVLRVGRGWSRWASASTSSPSPGSTATPTMICRCSPRSPTLWRWIRIRCCGSTPSPGGGRSRHGAKARDERNVAQHAWPARV